MRDTVSAFSARSLMDQKARLEIGARISERVRDLFKGAPFEVVSVELGNIEKDPRLINAEIEGLKSVREVEYAKQAEAKRQEVIAAKTANTQSELELAQAKQKVAAAEAEVTAITNKKVGESLTPQMLQMEYYKARQAMKDSPNKMFFFIPAGPNGVPLMTPPMLQLEDQGK